MSTGCQQGLPAAPGGRTRTQAVATAWPASSCRLESWLTLLLLGSARWFFVSNHGWLGDRRRCSRTPLDRTVGTGVGDCRRRTRGL